MYLPYTQVYSNAQPCDCHWASLSRVMAGHQRAIPPPPPSPASSSTVQSTSIRFSTGDSGLIRASETPCAEPKAGRRHTLDTDPAENWNPFATMSSRLPRLNMKPGDATGSGVASKTKTTPGRSSDSTLQQCNALSAKGHSLFNCLPDSAKVLAFSLPQMPTCDGTCNRFRSTRKYSKQCQHPGPQPRICYRARGPSTIMSATLGSTPQYTFKHIL